MYIKRNIEDIIVKNPTNSPIIMVCGQRQVGKSTMLMHLKENDRKYVSFDNPSIKRLAIEDPYLFIETYGLPILIDEFQKAPNILSALKDIVDTKSYNGVDTNGLIWLTGSQKFNMMKNISESLAGRVSVFEMSGLSQREKNGYENELISFNVNDLKNRKYVYNDTLEIYEKIFEGGMPKPYVQNIDREKYYSDYISTYLERDVRELSQIGKLNEFYNFIVFLAARTGQELKYDEISKQIGVSSPTIKNWISILEASGIIFLLKPYSSSVSKRLVKTPKLYFMDTGLAVHLTRWPNAEVLMNGNMAGAILETYVVTEIVKSYLNSGKPLNNLFYYRDFDQKEIDLLYVDGNSITPIEIKKNIDPYKPDKNFGLVNKFGLTVNPGLVFCMVKEITPINRNCFLIPISIL